MIKIKVGQTVVDMITGLEGVVTCRAEYLHGCVRVLIQPFGTKDGQPFESTYTDEPQVKVIKAKNMNSKAKGGGPRKDPPK